MKLLDVYIAKNVLAAIALVTLMLAGLQLFILFVAQLGDIGKADYSLWQAMIFVLLQMPYQVYLFFPMASLLGCLIGLGLMAHNSELIIMRAAGMSIGQIILAVLKTAIILIIAMSIISENIIPKLSYIANNRKISAINSNQSLRTAKGVWLHYDNDYLAIGTISTNLELNDVDQFRFDAKHHLYLIRKLKRIHYINNHWHAHDISETLLSKNHTETHNKTTMNWDLNLKPDVLSVVSTDPDEMSLYELYRYLHAHKKNQKAAHNYQLSYLQRLTQPLNTVVMMLLAIPFIFGPLRTSTMGSKFLAGASLGFCFQIINRFFAPISQLFQLSPLIAAFAPTCIFAILGLYLMRRAR